MKASITFDLSYLRRQRIQRVLGLPKLPNVDTCRDYIKKMIEAGIFLSDGTTTLDMKIVYPFQRLEQIYIHKEKLAYEVSDLHKKRKSLKAAVKRLKLKQKQLER